MTHSFNPARPWDWVFGQLTHKDEKDWWWEELEAHLFEGSLGAGATSRYVDQDHPVRGAASSTATTTPPQLPPPGGRTRRKRKAQAQQVDGSDNEVDLNVPPVPASLSPLLHKNHVGVGLCKGWQTGKCRKCDSMSRCIKDGTSVHQCARCLDNRHGAHWPQECTKSPGKPKPPSKRKRK